MLKHVIHVDGASWSEICSSSESSVWGRTLRIVPVTRWQSRSGRSLILQRLTSLMGMVRSSSSVPEACGTAQQLEIQLIVLNIEVLFGESVVKHKVLQISIWSSKWSRRQDWHWPPCGSFGGVDYQMLQWFYCDSDADIIHVCHSDVCCAELKAH